MVNVTDREQSVIREINLDPEAVQECIAQGSQNRVWKYGQPGKKEEVIKIPHVFISSDIFHRITSLLGGQNLESAREEEVLGEDYFEEHWAGSEIFSNKAGSIFGFKQALINYELITPETLTSGEKARKVREQMEDIMKRNRKMIKERGRWLDCMGFDMRRFVEFLSPEGTPYMDNIVLERYTHKVKIIDVGIYGFTKHLMQFLIQYENARRYGLDFGGDECVLGN